MTTSALSARLTALLTALLPTLLAVVLTVVALPSAAAPAAPAAQAAQAKPKKPTGLAVVVSGLPAGVAADVTVRFPKKGKKGKRTARVRMVSASATYKRAKAGRYVVTARPVSTPAGIATPTLAEQRVKVGKKRKRVTVRVAYTLAPAPPVDGWTAVAGGGSHTCAIRAPGTLWCWGSNQYGQLGEPTGAGTTTPVTTPVRVGAANDWVSVSAGDRHTCGLRAGGSLWCWGGNNYGQLATSTHTGTANPTLVPVKVGADNWASVSAGGGHTCGTGINGSLWCWGDNNHGQLGTTTNIGNPVVANPVPVKVGFDNWASVSAGGGHTCGTGVNGSVWCWGWNLFGQLGASTGKEANPAPVEVGSGGWASVSAGGLHTCGTGVNGSLWCWGYNLAGQVGTSTNAGGATPNPVPVKVGFDNWASVSAGGMHTCGTGLNGSLWCWGANKRGQLGSTVNAGGDGAYPVPVKVGADDWAGVSAGGDHTCGPRAGAGLWCWGGNKYGQLASTVNAGSDAPVVTASRVPE